MEWATNSARVHFSDCEGFLIVETDSENAILFRFGGKGGWNHVIDGTPEQCKQEAVKLSAR